MRRKRKMKDRKAYITLFTNLFKKRFNPKTSSFSKGFLSKKKFVLKEKIMKNRKAYIVRRNIKDFIILVSSKSEGRE